MIKNLFDVIPHPTITVGQGLTGGGNTSKSVTIGVNYGTGSGTVCQGNDSRLHNITISTGDPSGGANGDIWLKY